jgi:hypothetical protein
LESKKLVDITPDIRLLVDIGEANYEVPEAISELIANSMDARYEDEKLVIDVSITDEEIKIIDDGKGMSQEVLGEALRLAAQMDKFTGNTKPRKGMYGLGLKAACASLGKHWEIVTRENKDKYQYTVRIDLKEWLKKSDRGSWQVVVEKQEFKKDKGPIGHLDHGTAIVITDLKEQFHMIAAVADRLGMAYKPHLETGDLIRVNTHEVVPKKFTLVEDRKYEINLDVNGHKVTGWYGLDIKTHNSGDYGINIYRQGQLVEPWNKDFIRAHLMSSRVVGEIDLPFVAANFHKKGFNKTTEEWRLVKKILTSELKHVVKASGQMAQNKKDSLRQAKAIQGLDAALGLISSEDQDFDGVKDNNSEIVNRENTNQVNQKNSVTGNFQSITIDGENISLSYVFESLKQTTIPWDFIYDEETKDLQAVINTDSRIYNLNTDEKFIAILALAEAVMSFSIKHKSFSYSKAKEQRDNWLHMAMGIREKAPVQA